MEVVKEYDYYTLDQARVKLAEEAREEARKENEKRKAEALEFVKTLPIRLFAIIMMILTVLLTLHIDGELLIAWFFVFPLGLFVTFAKSKTLLYSGIISW